MSHYPPFRLERVREALAEVYHLLGLMMPPATVVPDLFDGYDLARADAAGVAQDACRCVLADSAWRATAEGVLETIWSLCWEDTLLINQRRFAKRMGMQPDSRAERRAFSRTDFI